MEKYRKYYGILLAGFASIFWGISDTMSDALIKLDHLNSDLLVSSKMLFAGLVLIVYSMIRHGNKKTFSVFTDKKDILRLLIFVIFGMTLMQLAYYKAMTFSNASTATILQFTSPFFVVLWVALRQKMAPRRVDIIGLIFALLGSYLVITKGNLSTISIGNKALFWGILSAVASAAYTLLPGKLLNKYGSVAVVGWAMTIGGLILNIRHPFWQMPKLSLMGIFLYAFVFFFGTVLAYFMYLASLKYASPSAVSMLDSFEPLSATLSSVVFLNLHYGLPEIIGTILVISTAFIMAYGSSNEEPL